MANQVGLLNHLIDGGFFEQAEQQLHQARTVLHQQPDMEDAAEESESEDLGNRHYGLPKKVRKQMYNYVITKGQYKEGMAEVEGDADDVFYIVSDHLMFIFGQRLSEVKIAADANYRIAGNLAIYHGRHRIKGRTFFTVLIDTRYSFDPPALN